MDDFSQYYRSSLKHGQGGKTQIMEKSSGTGGGRRDGAGGGGSNQSSLFPGKNRRKRAPAAAAVRVRKAQRRDKGGSGSLLSSSSSGSNDDVVRSEQRRHRSPKKRMRTSAGSTGSAGGGQEKVTHEQRWVEMFNRLVAYKKKYGNCLVPNRYPGDPALGFWVSAQRRQYKIVVTGKEGSSALTPERAAKLEQIGFEWQTTNPHHTPWETRYAELCQFVERFGHAEVPMRWQENPKLSHWVSKQRHDYKLRNEGKSSMLTDRKLQLLNDINFFWEGSRRSLKEKVNLSSDSEDEKESAPTGAGSSLDRKPAARSTSLTVPTSGSSSGISQNTDQIWQQQSIAGYANQPAAAAPAPQDLTQFLLSLASAQEPVPAVAPVAAPSAPTVAADHVDPNQAGANLLSQLLPFITQQSQQQQPQFMPQPQQQQSNVANSQQATLQTLLQQVLSGAYQNNQQQIPPLAPNNNNNLPLSNAPMLDANALSQLQLLLQMSNAVQGSGGGGITFIPLLISPVVNSGQLYGAGGNSSGPNSNENTGQRNYPFNPPEPPV